MATLYWGGGTGTWDGFDNTHWYTDFARLTLSSSAPSAADDVVFDSVSNATAYTVTLANNTTVCKSCTIAGPATGNVTFAGSGQLHIYGDLTFPATGFTRTFTSQIYFWATSNQNLTTNGVSLSNALNIVGIGGSVTLQDALTTTQILFGAGTLNTNGKTVTLSSNIITITSTGIGGSSTISGTLNLGASTVTATTFASGTGTPASLIINGGTSNVTLTAATASVGGATFTGGTFYNVTFSSSVISTSNFYGNNTFNNLTFTTRSTAGVSNIISFGNQTINGTLTISGQSSVNRYFVRSDTIGTPRTLTVGTVAALTDVDFRDVTVAGASAPWSGTRLGDCLGNTNITFPAAKTVYWNSPTGGAWSDTVWATSSGGAVNSVNFPLAQDTAIIDDTGLNSGAVITFGISANVKNVTSTKTNAYTFGAVLNIYGSVTLTSSTTTTNLSLTFAGRSPQTFTSAGASLLSFVVSNVGSTVTLQDNFTFGGSSIILSSGTFDLNGYNLNANNFFFQTTLPKTLKLGTGTLTLSSGISNFQTVSNITVVPSTSSVVVTGTSSVNFGSSGNSLAWNNVTFSSPFTSGSLYGNNTFNNLTIPSPTASGGSILNIYGDQTVSGTLALGGGSSATQRLIIQSPFPSTGFVQRTITAASVTGLSDVDFYYIKGAGTATWTGGTRIGDCGGNSGIGFSSPKTVYWNLAGSQTWVSTGWATSSGGVPSVNNFPLPQDTAVFDNAGSAGTISLTSGCYIGNINAGSRTSAMTFSDTSVSGASILGNLTYGSGVTDSVAGILQFLGTGTQTFVTAGVNINHQIYIIKPSGTFQHGDAYTGAQITVSAGNYSTQNYNITSSGVGFSAAALGSNVVSADFGTSVVTISGSGFAIGSTNTTFSGASSTINMSSTSTKTFTGGGQTFGTVSSTGGTTNALTIVGSNTFGTLTNSAYTYMIWTAGTTQTITNFTYTGAAGNVVRWYTNIPGQRATIKQSPTGSSLAAVGTNSTDGGNNSGLTFTGSSPNYFYVKDIAYSAGGSSSNFFMMFR